MATTAITTTTIRQPFERLAKALIRQLYAMPRRVVDKVTDLRNRMD